MFPISQIKSFNFSLIVQGLFYCYFYISQFIGIQILVKIFSASFFLFNLLFLSFLFLFLLFDVESVDDVSTFSHPFVFNFIFCALFVLCCFLCFLLFSVWFSRVSDSSMDAWGEAYPCTRVLGTNSTLLVSMYSLYALT